MYNYNCQEGNRLIIAERQKGEKMEDMPTEIETKKNAIEKYVNIQRIKRGGREEIDYQERIAKTELQILGISTEDLELKEAD